MGDMVGTRIKKSSLKYFFILDHAASCTSHAYHSIWQVQTIFMKASSSHAVATLEKGIFLQPDLQIIIVEWLTYEKHLALYPAGTIVRDSHYGRYLTPHKQDLKLRRSSIQGLLSEVFQ